MAEDIIKPAGATKASQPSAGGANTRIYPVLGIVKNNVDPTRSGRIQVYIDDLGSNDPDNSNAWTTVSYMSPFFGSVEPKAGDTGYGDYTSNPSSYGFWSSPPDLGSTVICIFINGDPSYGFYVGCVPKPETLYMVPAIGASEYIIANEGEAKSYGGATRLPVTNINTNNSTVANSPGFAQEPRPVHSYSAMIMAKQGLIRDPIRGPISSSSQRESPSRVGWGVSTPGRPIYQGGYTDATIGSAAEAKVPDSGLKVVSRRGGHSIVMDDGNLIGQDQLVRIRSAAGHQILMSDDGQTLFIIHSNGQSYIELGKEGTIDMYSTNSVNVRTQGDLNLHADGNMNIQAKKKLNIRAEEINIESEQNTNHRVGGNYSTTTQGTFTHGVSGPMSMQSGGEASFASSAVTYINGSRINLNTGSTSTTPQTVPSIQQNAHTDTVSDSVKGYIAAPGKLQSITSRAPAHSPWANACKGVDVKTDNSIASSLPASPSPAVAQVNAAAATTAASNPITIANAASVPASTAVSASIDKNATGALVGAAAQAAAAGPAALATTAGSAVVPDINGQPTAYVGKFAMTPQQMEAACVIKPGTATIVDSLVQGGATVEEAMTPNMFTGQLGVNTFQQFVDSTPAQQHAQVISLQKSQAALTRAGVITGKESPTAIGGLVLSGSLAGVRDTINALSTIPGINRSQVYGASSVVTNVTKLLNAGNYAAGMSETSLGGMAAIANAASGVVRSVGALQGGNNGRSTSNAASDLITAATAITAASNISKISSSINQNGVSAGAVAAILDQLKPLAARVPQNLRAIANASRAGRQTAAELSGIGQVLGTVGRITGGTTGAALAGTSSLFRSLGSLATASSPYSILSASSNVLRSAGSISNIFGDNQNQTGQQTAAGYNPAVYAAQRAANRVGGAQGSTSLSAAQAVSMFGNTLSAVNVLSNPKASLTSTLNAATSLYNTTNRIVSIAGAASYASGVSSLPGGQDASCTINNLDKYSPLNGTQGVTSLINTSSTAVNNGISVSDAISGSIDSINNQVSSTIQSVSTGLSNISDQLKAGTTTLAASVLDGAPADVAAGLSSAMASASSLGANSTSLPVAAENTYGSDLDIASLLGDPIIPPPDFGAEPSSVAQSALQYASEQYDRQSAIGNQILDLVEQEDVAKKTYYELQNSLPQGNPEIEAARQYWYSLVIQIESLSSQLNSTA